MSKKTKYANFGIIKYLLIGILFFPVLGLGDVAFTRYDTSEYFPVDVQLDMVPYSIFLIGVLILIIISFVLILLCKIITESSSAKIDNTAKQKSILGIKRTKKMKVFLLFFAMIILVYLFYFAGYLLFRHSLIPSAEIFGHTENPCRIGVEHNYVNGKCTNCGLKKIFEGGGGRDRIDPRLDHRFDTVW